MPRTILIVGFGSIGAKHLAAVRAVAPKAAVVVLRRPQSRPADGLDGVTVVTTMDEALAHCPEVAVVAGPAPGHVAAATALARAGVSLLVEKPIAAQTDGVAELIDLCVTEGVTLQVGYCLRFDPELAALKQAIDGGRIGRLLSLRAEVGQFLPDWRPGTDYRGGVSARADLGGGVLLELSHEIDMVRWLAGEPLEIDARLGHSGILDIDKDLEDSADLLMAMADGVTASVHMDMVQRPAHRTCRAVGSEGALVWDGVAHTVRLFTPEAPDGVSLVSEGAGRAPLLETQLRHFLDCVARGAAPRVGGMDGLKVLQIIAAARVAATEGRRIRP